MMVGLALVGCQSSSGTSNVATEPASISAGDNSAAPADRSTTADDQAVIIPITTGTGVVARVNDTLRFVVLDYALTQLPNIDQILFLYRKGQKVARVKVTGPVRGQTVAADIIEGVAADGDEVRAE